jgi:putative ABC transport system permease protein
VLPDDKILPERLVAGQMISAADDRGALVSEFTLYQLGVTDDEQVEALLGKALTLEVVFSDSAQEFTVLDLLQVNPGGLTLAEEKALHKIAVRLPAALDRLGLDPADEALLKKLVHKGKHIEKPLIVTEALTLRGVLAVGGGRPKNILWGWAYDGVDVALPQRTAESLYFKYPRFQKYGFERLQVEVDEIDHVKAVNEQIKAMGVDTYCLAEVLDKEQFTYLLVFASMTIVAGIALLVAALGITNTMLMSVLERVREIGIMKAVGARELHLRLLFLVEGGLLGLVGGLLGLGLGWAASFPADAWVKSLVEGRLDLKLDRSLFAFPPWLVVGVPLFTWLVTTLAAYYPARRAARIDPIQALRHE